MATLGTSSNNLHKLFAFIENKNDLNDINISNSPYNQSIIVCKSSGQLYNPLTQTWISIDKIKYNKYINYQLQTQHCKICDILWDDLIITTDIRPIEDNAKPIGICIAPYGYLGVNEAARFLSLKFMDYNDPDNGSVIGPIAGEDGQSKKIIISDNNTKPTNMKEWLWNDSTIDEVNNSSGYVQYSIRYLLRNEYHNEQISFNNIIYYPQNNKCFFEPSSSLYDHYSIVEQLKYNDELDFDVLNDLNFMLDINGKENTKNMIDTLPNDSWKTSATITNTVNTADQYPAAQCCWRFNPGFTEQGDWYLPSVGELIPLLTFNSSIINKIQSIAQIYPNDCILKEDDIFTSNYSNASCSTLVKFVDDQQAANYKSLHISFSNACIYFVNNKNYVHGIFAMLQIPEFTSKSLKYKENTYSNEINYFNEYLTLKFFESGTFKMNIEDNAEIEYKYNNNDWQLYTKNQIINVTSNDTIQLKCLIENGIVKSTNNRINIELGDDITPIFEINCNFIVYGNLMSIIYGDDFNTLEATSPTPNECVRGGYYNNVPSPSVSDYCYYLPLFYNCSKLLESHNLIIDHIDADKWFFAYFFSGCVNMKTTPILPSICDKEMIFYKMFDRCRSLTETAKFYYYNDIDTIHEHNIGKYSCSNMYYNCVSLTTINNLRTNSIQENGMSSMFSGCVNLINTSKVFLKGAAKNSYSSMFYGCSSLTNIYADLLNISDMSNSDGCCQYMFANCSSLTAIPQTLLKTTILADYCYNHMFDGCSSITEILVGTLPATTLANHCYDNMFTKCNGITQLNAGLLPAMTVYEYSYASMFLLCANLTTIDDDLLPATTLSKGSYYSMFWQCKKLKNVNIQQLPATEIPVRCYQSMFNLCDLRTISANLLINAIRLHDGCFIRMFRDNSKLTTLPTLNKNIEFIATEELDWDNSQNVGVINNNRLFPGLQADSEYNTYGYQFMEMFRNTAITSIPALYLDFASYKNSNNLINNKESICIFGGMFTSCPHLTQIQNDLFGTNKNKQLGKYAFIGMFIDCNNLNITPNKTLLGFNNISKGCYRGIFYKCSSITNINENVLQNDNLNITLSDECYYGMFGYTGITQIPQNIFAHISVLSDYCFAHMFDACNGLTNINNNLLTNFLDLKPYCYSDMFWECNYLTQAPSLPATTLKEGCYAEMFYNCTRLTTAPTLSATTLVSGCYNYMFRGCTSLNYIKAMFTTTPSTTYTNNWVFNVSQTGTFVKSNAAQWNVTGVNGIPNGWTVQTAT